MDNHFPVRPTGPRLPPRIRVPAHSHWSVRSDPYTVNGATEHRVADHRPKYSMFEGIRHKRLVACGSASVWRSFPETARGNERVRIELFVQRIGGHRLARAGRVHETPLADVDTHVIHAAAVDPEKYEIAALQFARLHFLGMLRLVARGARHREPELPVRIEDESAAIETIARSATVAVARAAQAERECRQRLAAVLHRRGAAAAIPVLRIEWVARGFA